THLRALNASMNDPRGARYQRRPIPLIGHLCTQIEERVDLRRIAQRINVAAEIEGMIGREIRTPAPSLGHWNREQPGNRDHLGPPGGVDAILNAWATHSGMRLASLVTHRHFVYCLNGSSQSSRSSCPSRPST